jgi:hypothetical protein
VLLGAISEITDSARTQHSTQTGGWLFMNSTETAVNAVMIKVTDSSHRFS